MCIIVDANRAHALFSQPQSEAAAPIWDWLKKDGILVCGGKLAAELGKVTASRRLLVELLRGGRAVLETAEDVDREECVLRATGHCRSDDQHIVALARVSGARVLFTEDRLLMDDFQNPRLLRPKGKIYRRSSHRKLLTHRRGCRKNRR